VQLAASAGYTHMVRTHHRTVPEAQLAGTPYKVDLCEAAEVAACFDAVRPQVVIHAACSNRSEAAIVPGTENIARAAAAAGARLVHISSDTVHDGEHAPYDEDALTGPCNSYGRAKVAAEQAVLSLCPAAVIVRTSLVFGIDPLDHQTRWVVNDAESGKLVRLFTDESRSPTWVDTLAHALLELGKLDYSGVLNVASPISLRRWDFGMLMFELLGITPGPNVQRALLADSGMERARDLTLNVSRAQALLQTPLLTPQQAVQKIRASN
jgi:dTDP-4-dehydrorhamnose reductase